MCVVLAWPAAPLAQVARPEGHADPADRLVRGYVSKRWTTANGLPHNAVSAILQTRDGYLWIGTRGGLLRFDGLTFTTFNVLSTPVLGADPVNAVHESTDGTLWIGTDAGLIRYSDGVFTAERLDDDGSPARIIDIQTDRDGRLWAATPEWLFRRDGARWTPVAVPFGRALGLSSSPSGSMWIATSAGASEWRDGVVRALTTDDGLPSANVSTVHEDRRGRVWLGTDRGVAYLDPGALRVVPMPGRLTAPITSMFEDGRGVLWIGAIGLLFTISPDGTLSESSVAAVAEQAAVSAFAEDRDGQIWYGVFGGTGGLNRLSAERVTTLAHQQGLPCDNVGAITQGDDGTVWLSTLCGDGRGLVSMRNGRITSHGGPAYVASLLAEPDGTVWAGTFNGLLYRRHDRGFVEVESPVQHASAAIAAIYRHGDGSLWLGTAQGLFVSRGDGEWTRIRIADNSIGDDVRTIAGDQDGALWIGTAAGVGRSHNGQFTTYDTADGLPAGAVRAIHVDTDGVAWLGSYGGGLIRLKDGAVTVYGVRGGALDSTVHRIVDTGDGTLWLTGDHGIRRVSKSDLHAIADRHADTLAATVYAEADGMISAECNGMAQPGGWLLQDGTLLVPTQRGAVGVDTTRPNSARPLLPPRIEAVIVDGTSMPLASEIVVPAGARDVEVRYTAPVLLRPEQVQFRYRLDGDDEWNAVGARRVASFANLRPGRHQLLVAARNGSGDWSGQPVALSLLLQPYFYQRRPVQAALVGLVLLAAGIAVRSYAGALRRRADALERAVVERTADLTEARERLATANDGLVKAKQEVEQAHGQVVAVLQQLDIGALLVTSAGIVRYASAAAQRVLQKDESALSGRLWSMCLPLAEADRARVAARVDAPSSHEERVPAQMVIDGRRYWMEIEVREEPPPGDGRILYLHHVTETAALPGGHADAGDGMVGRSTVMLLVRRQIQDVARVDSTVLIEGETGSGKELVARAIHQRGHRAARPFVAVNAAGLAESLLASQLFGHRRGAFTGAVDDQIGYFEAANGGTLFLDEIGDMPLSMQAGLLRVLQEREVTRLGESRPRRVDVRFIAATHRNLLQETAAGRFREDLLYRIRVAVVVVPPLRNRIEDVPLLVEAFLTHAAKQAGRPVPHLSRDAMDALFRHPWPGNVRELRAIIERAMIAAPHEVIRLEDLPLEIARERGPMEVVEAGADLADDRDRIVDALRRAKGNRAQAARLLGIGRTTLYKRLAAYGLD